MWEDDWMYNVTVASDQPKNYDVDWVFGFHQYKYYINDCADSDLWDLNTDF